VGEDPLDSPMRFHHLHDPLDDLGHLGAGERARITDIHGGRGFVSRLATLGFTIGAPIDMVQNYGRGPIIVMVRDSRIALGRGEAHHIKVERL
jgi:ferrous iron transport protein A